MPAHGGQAWNELRLQTKFATPPNVPALELTQDKPTLSVVELRDHLSCGRNVVIDVLEYFDTIGFTRRQGDTRIILNRGLPDEQFAT